MVGSFFLVYIVSTLGYTSIYIYSYIIYVPIYETEEKRYIQRIHIIKHIYIYVWGKRKTIFPEQKTILALAFFFSFQHT